MQQMGTLALYKKELRKGGMLVSSRIPTSSTPGALPSEETLLSSSRRWAWEGSREQGQCLMGTSPS